MKKKKVVGFFKILNNSVTKRAGKIGPQSLSSAKKDFRASRRALKA